MAYIVDQLDHLGGDFQEGGYLYKPTSGTQWIPEHCEYLTGLMQKQASAKADLRTFSRSDGKMKLYPLAVMIKTLLCHQVGKWQVLTNLVAYLDCLIMHMVDCVYEYK